MEFSSAPESSLPSDTPSMSGTSSGVSGMSGASDMSSSSATTSTDAMGTSESTTTKDGWLKVYFSKVQAEGFADGYYSGVITIAFVLFVVWLIYCCCRTRRAWQNLDDSHIQVTGASEMHPVRAGRPGFDAPELRWEVGNTRPSDDEPDAPPARPDPFKDGIAWRG